MAQDGDGWPTARWPLADRFWRCLCGRNRLPYLAGQPGAAQQDGKDGQCEQDMVQQGAEGTVQPVMVVPARMMMVHQQGS